MNTLNRSTGRGLSLGGLTLGRQRATTREFLTTVFRDWRLMVAVFILTAAIFVVVAFFITTTFTAQSRLLVLFSREYSAQSAIADASSFLPDQSQVVRNEIELLTSPVLIEQVLDDLGIETLYPDMVHHSFIGDALRGARDHVTTLLAKAGVRRTTRGRLSEQRVMMNASVRRFLDELSIIPVKDANIISVSFTHPDPELAAGAVNTLVQHYQEQRRQIFTEDKTKQLAAERDRFADRLATTDKDLEEFRTTNQISAFDDQKALLLRQQAETSNDKMSSQIRLAEAQARFNQLTRSGGTVPKDIPLYTDKENVDAADNLRAALLTLKLRRSELSTKFTDNSRYITDLDTQIRDTENLLAQTPSKSQDAVRTGRNPVYDQIQNDLVTQGAEVESLKSRLTALDLQLQSINDRLADFNRLERSYNSLALSRALVEQNLKTYSQKLEEAQIQENTERSKAANVRVIEEATPPSVGSATRRVVVGIGMLLAAAASVVVLLLLDATRDVLITPEAVSRSLRLPVLISIAHRNPPPRRDWRAILGDIRKALDQIAGTIKAGGAAA